MHVYLSLHDGLHMVILPCFLNGKERILVNVSLTWDWTVNERPCHVSIRKGGSSLCADEGQFTSREEYGKSKVGEGGMGILLD